jgi:hypothetical protein
MTLMIFQALLSVIAGVALFSMWRRVASSNRWVAWLVTAGVLIRAVCGQVVFWISYLHLPVARSLQLGDGFWIFGLDAMTYFQQATGVAASGPAGILFASRGFGSVFYVQTLATVILLFGAVESVALLLNIGAYLGCCLIALSFGDPAKHRAVVFTIAALSLAPATVMWSLQPMKDTWFMFLVAAFFGAARLWQRAWIAPNASWGRRIGWTLALAAALYGISGIRWYFGLIAACACLPFFALTILRTKPRGPRLAAAAVVAPFLFVTVWLASGPSISVVLTFVHPNEPRIVAIPRAFLTYLRYSRAGFERTGGATMIGAGHAISAVDAHLGNREERVAPINVVAAKVDQKRVAPKPAETHPAVVTPALTVASTAASTPPAPTPVEVRVASKPVAPKPSETRPAVVDLKAPSTRVSKPASTTASKPPGPGLAKVRVASKSVETKPVVPKPSETRPAVTARKASSTPVSKPPSTSASAPAPAPATNKPAVVVPAPTAVAKAAPPPARAITPPAAVAVRTSPRTVLNSPDDAATGTVAIPASHTARFLAGTAAMILPRAIAQRMGILDVRGGRGLWLFVEVDTIAFDAVLVFCFAAVIGAVRRRELRAPVFWLILIVTVVVGGLLAYTVSNFGTLFRHREMVLLGLLLLPLAALPQGDASALAAKDAHDAVDDLPNAVQRA